jgi:hypothetical protein
MVLNVLRLGAGITFHLAGPLQKAKQLFFLTPEKSPEFQESDLIHLYAAIRLDSPAEIRTAPWCDAMAFGCIPKEAECVAHSVLSSSVYQSIRQKPKGRPTDGLID